MDFLSSAVLKENSKSVIQSNLKCCLVKKKFEKLELGLGPCNFKHLLNRYAKLAFPEDTHLQ